MKVLFTVHTYLPNSDGVEFVTKYLAEGLAEKGHYVKVITYMYPKRCNVKSECINNVDILRWNASTLHLRHRGDKYGYQKYILKHQSEFDVMVNVGTQTALTDWLFEIADKITIPRLLYIHSIWDFKINKEDRKSFGKLCTKMLTNLRWGVYYAINGNQFKKYEIITQLHEKDYSFLYFKNKYNINSRIIENAVESDFFVDDDEMTFKEKCIINVANFNDRKNQVMCIDLFCKSNIPDGWKLMLIGSEENEYSCYLRKKVEEYEKKGILNETKKVEILSGQQREKIYKYVRKSSIYLMTSKWEAFPISLIEAMAAGVPFISSDVGIVEYLEGGRIAKSERAYCEELEKMTTDDVYRMSIGEMGRKAAKMHYQIRDKVDRLESYLIEILERKSE